MTVAEAPEAPLAPKRPAAQVVYVPSAAVAEKLVERLSRAGVVRLGIDCEFRPDDRWLTEDQRMVLHSDDEVARARLVSSDAIKRVTFDPHRNVLTCLQLGAEVDGKLVGLVFDVGQIGTERLGSILRPLLHWRDDLLLIGQNIGVEYKMLFKHLRIRLKRMSDTLYRERVLTAGSGLRCGLGHLRVRRLGYEEAFALEEKETTRLSFLWHEGKMDREQIDYAGRDAADVLPIWDSQEADFTGEDKLRQVAASEDDVIPVIGDMELRGIIVDQDHWRNLATQADEHCAKLWDDLQVVFVPKAYKDAMGEFASELDFKLLKLIDPNSWQDVQRAFRGAGLKAIGNIDLKDTSDATLLNYRRAFFEKYHRDDCPPIDLILNYRQWHQRKKTFGLSWLDYVSPVTGAVHCSYNQYGAVSGRFSCSLPNMQQIPSRGAHAKKYRAAFRARPGHKLTTCDWSQIELRIIAALSGDPVMLDAFRRGIDMHSLTASKILGVDYDELERRRKDKNDPEHARFETIRDIAKILNFGIAYGMGPPALSVKTAEADPKGVGIRAYCTLTREEVSGGQRCGSCARCALQVYRDTYRVAAAWLERQGREALMFLTAEDMAGGRRVFRKPNLDLIKEKLQQEDGLFGPDLLRKAQEQFRSEQAALQNEAKNHPIQGTNSRMLKIAMRRIWERLQRECKGAWIVHVVHDEIVTEAPVNKADLAKTIVVEEMVGAAQRFLGPMGIPTPVSHAIEDTWSK